MRIAFAGTPGFALPPLRALGARHSIVGVLTQPDRPAGRGRALTASPVKLEAEARGWPLAQPVTLKSEEDRAVLRAWQPDVLVVVAYGLILPQAALDIPRLGCINVHASLLPRWRGAAPIQRAILAGDADSGVSIMRMEAGLDTGPVYAMRRVPIGPRMTGGELHDALAAEGAVALIEVLDAIEAGTARAVPQSAAGVTYAAKIDKAEARIDWARSAIEIDRQVRAFNPWPIAETRYAGEQLRILRAQPDAAAGAGRAAAPGTVLGAGAQGIRVACGSGVLAIESVQRPGRKPVRAADFAHATPLEGVVLG
ncbi:MAG TPA: methionyl-tRNA formyltransferase [Steroidobacteraceae bacterium]|nr:methionyl-tRNA formyltransferase [Steroidobacteraceae bacterium]HNS26743.1 methionyl-tRNA formyltransferase [Steroidobacteraceae bacterium]